MRPGTATLRDPSVTDVTDDEVAADLRAAAGLIRRRGLAKGLLYEPSTGALCQSGALMEAVCPGFWTGRAPEAPLYMDGRRKARYLLAETAVRSFLGSVGLVIPGLRPAVIRWNDAHERTAEQVAVALEAAADALALAA